VLLGSALGSAGHQKANSMSYQQGYDGGRAGDMFPADNSAEAFAGHMVGEHDRRRAIEASKESWSSPGHGGGSVEVRWGAFLRFTLVAPIVVGALFAGGALAFKSEVGESALLGSGGTLALCLGLIALACILHAIRATFLLVGWVIAESCAAWCWALAGAAACGGIAYCSGAELLVEPWAKKAPWLSDAACGSAIGLAVGVLFRAARSLSRRRR